MNHLFKIIMKIKSIYENCWDWDKYAWRNSYWVISKEFFHGKCFIFIKPRDLLPI